MICRVFLLIYDDQIYAKYDDQIYDKYNDQIYDKYDDQIYNKYDDQIYNKYDDQIDDGFLTQIYSKCNNKKWFGLVLIYYKPVWFGSKISVNSSEISFDIY